MTNFSANDLNFEFFFIRLSNIFIPSLSCLYFKKYNAFLKDNKSIDMISPEISDNIDILKNLIV